MIMKKSIKIFIDSLDVLEELTDEQAGQLFKAIRAYEIDNKEILTGILKAVFTPFKNNLDRAEVAYRAVCERNRVNGAKGGRPNPNKPSGLKSNPNNPKKDKDKDKDINTIVEIVSFLNNVTSSKFRDSSDKTRSLIKSRLNENYTIIDFKRVIETKHSQWNGTEQEKYLRPETLFGNKFEGYLNESRKINSVQELDTNGAGGQVW